MQWPTTCKECRMGDQQWEKLRSINHEESIYSECFSALFTQQSHIIRVHCTWLLWFCSQVRTTLWSLLHLDVSILFLLYLFQIFIHTIQTLKLFFLSISHDSSLPKPMRFFCLDENSSKHCWTRIILFSKICEMILSVFFL